jgi:hypothetical protein
MKRDRKNRLLLSRETLTDLSKRKLERAAGGTGSDGCMSVMMTCPTIDKPCNSIYACETEGCAAGGSGGSARSYRPKL